MTKKDLIKKILELGKELEKANGFDAIMIINDMEIEIDNYTKQLPMHDVGGQSEQLTCECLGLGRITQCHMINNKWICTQCNRPLAGQLPTT